MEVSATTIVTLAGVQYLGQVVLKSRLSKGLVPATLVPCDSALTLQAIDRLLATWRSVDDVFGGAPASFSNLLMVQRGSESQRLQPSTGIVTITSPNSLAPGPYFIHKDQVHQAWRLYPDTLGAFVVPLIPDSVLDPADFSVLPTLSPDALHKTIAVPSRLSTTVTPSKPLAGRRLALNECYDIAGLRKTLGSRHFADVDSPADRHADFVQTLLGLGAVILGTTKTGAFALDDVATDQWVDQHIAFNPRADGYQNPAGSSTGPAVALAGYDWVDYAVGRDALDGIRGPAAANGLFSLRTTHGVTSLRGSAPCGPTFDTVGLLSRTLNGLHTLARLSLPVLKPSSSFPKRIIFLKEFFPVDDERAPMFDAAFRILEQFLGLQRTELRLADEWQHNPPPEAQGQGIHAYLEHAGDELLFRVPSADEAQCGIEPMCREFYAAYEPFRAEFRAKHGHNPYEPPNTAYRWNVARAITNAQADEGMARRRVFQAWFEANVMRSTDTMLSDAVLLLPLGNPGPTYLDDQNPAPCGFEPVSISALSPMLQIPQIVVPFGQLAYPSRITNRQEYIPVSMGMLGAKGSDLMLIRLAHDAFSAAQWPTSIGTGRLMFPLGDNMLNTGAVSVDDAVPSASWTGETPGIAEGAQVKDQSSARMGTNSDDAVDALALGITDATMSSSPPPKPERFDSLVPVAHDMGVGQAL